MTRSLTHRLVALAALAAAVMMPLQSAVAQMVPAPIAAAAPRAQGTGPALWVVRDADSTIYLFGTVHILRPTTAWGSNRVDAAFDSADQVWLEISNPNDQAALLPLVREHGLSPQRPLSSLLTADQFADLDAAARTIGASAAQLDVFRPWFAALTLSVAPLSKAGYDPASGVEMILMVRAEALGKPIHGFETLDKQIRILAGMPEQDQLAFLTGTLENFDDATVELDGLVEAWAKGDVATIERLGAEDMREESPLIYDELLTKRNTDWAQQIRTLLDGSGTIFVAVGAAHLAGPDSVQVQLAKLGIEATPAPANDY